MNEEWEDLEGPGSMVPYRTVVCSLTIPGEPDPLTTFVIAALAIACAAFCVWLTVRLVNRKGRWARWTLTGIIVLYPTSFVPFLWLINRDVLPLPLESAGCRMYSPLMTVADSSKPTRQFKLWIGKLCWPGPVSDNTED